MYGDSTTPVVGKILQFLNRTFGIYRIKGIEIAPTYWQAFAIIFLIFLLILTLARLRHLYVHWSVSKPSLSMIFWGFLLAIILEGFLFIGGKSFLTLVLGWKNVPKPISTALDIGRERLRSVLGTSQEALEIQNAKPSYKSVIQDYQSLTPLEAEEVKSFICGSQNF